MLFFESQCSPRAWEVKGGRDSDQTEQAEFQLGAEGDAVVICMYAVCQGMSSTGPSSGVGIRLPPSPCTVPWARLIRALTRL